MNKLIIFLIVFMLMFTTPILFKQESVSAQGTSYYVKNGGNDSADGLSDATAWATVGKVVGEFGNLISEGDDIYFKRGDTFNDETLDVWATGGTHANPMIFGAYGTGDKPRFTTTPIGSQIILKCSGSVAPDNVTFENLNLSGSGVTYAFNIEGDGCFKSDIHLKNIELYECQLIVRDVRNYFIENLVSHPNNAALHGIAIGEGATAGIVRNLSIIGSDCKDGINFHFASGGSGDLDELAGNVLGDEHLIENFTIEASASENAIDAVGGLGCEWVIMRNGSIKDGAFVTISLGHEQHYMLLENIHAYNNLYNTLAISDAHYNIMRYCTLNLWTNNLITTDLGQYDPYGGSNIYLYNNNFIGDGDGDYIQLNAGTDEWDGPLVFKNNIWHSTAYSSPSAYIHFISNGGTPSLSNIDSNWTYNMWWRGDGIGNTEAWMRTAGVSLNFTEWGDEPEVDNELLDDPEMADASAYDYTLNSTSPCIDAGGWLTTTNGSGTGTIINVTDSAYFFPRLTKIGCYPYWENISGDKIFIGDDLGLEVVSVDYYNETITVNRSISWDDDDAVSLMNYTGNQVDIGAKEAQLWSNRNPVNSNPAPGNAAGSVSIDIANFSVTVTDADGNQSMNVTFRTNESGVWLDLQTNTSVSSGVVYCLNTTFVDSYSTTYYWSVNTSDNHTTPAWDNDTYYFTTQTEPATGVGWQYYYGNDTGTNFTVSTYEVIQVYINGSVSNVTIYMTHNSGINYSATRTINLTYNVTGNGYNYTGVVNNSNATTDLSTQNTSLFVSPADDGYFIGLWNETHFWWNFWVCGFTFEDKYIHQYDVLVTKIRSSRDWTI